MVMKRATVHQSAPDDGEESAGARKKRQRREPLAPLPLTPPTASASGADNGNSNDQRNNAEDWTAAHARVVHAIFNALDESGAGDKWLRSTEAAHVHAAAQALVNRGAAVYHKCVEAMQQHLHAVAATLANLVESRVRFLVAFADAWTAFRMVVTRYVKLFGDLDRTVVLTDGLPTLTSRCLTCFFTTVFEAHEEALRLSFLGAVLGEREGCVVF